MTGPDYVYLFYTMMQTIETLQPWEDGTSMSTDERTTRMDAFRSMKQVHTVLFVYVCFLLDIFIVRSI